MPKKTYTAPTVIRHGSAVELTLGGGFRWAELIGWRSTWPS